MRLTRKQKQFMEALDRFYKRHGHPPSHQEIADEMGFRSKGTVSDYVRALRAHGHEDITSYCLRGKSTVASQEGTSLPLLGRVAAGHPIEAYLNDESIDVPPQMLKPEREHYCLEVNGDSMVEDAILDGDHVIIRRQSSAQNGQTVVARLEGEATLKKFFKKRNRIELHPANSKYDPISVTPSMNFAVEGVLTGVLRLVK